MLLPVASVGDGGGVTRLTTGGCEQREQTLLLGGDLEQSVAVRGIELGVVPQGGGHARGNPHSYAPAHLFSICLLYTSDAADEEDSVDLGGRRIIKKKK